MADEIVVAVTGVSGFLGQRLLPLLDASPGVARIVGLDIRDPARRARKLQFHRVDVRAGVEQRQKPLSEEARDAGHRDDDFSGHGP